MIKLFRGWKPKGKMYSFRCSQCGLGFLSSYQLDAPICGKCLQKAKSLDSTVDYDKSCPLCGNRGVIYGKEQCHSCYFGFRSNQALEKQSMCHLVIAYSIDSSICTGSKPCCKYDYNGLQCGIQILIVIIGYAIFLHNPCDNNVCSYDHDLR